MFEPIRGGTRGGQAEFKWSDVSADKDREHYLGHSINAPTGRWQRNKDIHWYNRDIKTAEEERQAEIRQIKEVEEEAMAQALGFAPTKKSTITVPIYGNAKGGLPVSIQPTSSASPTSQKEDMHNQARLLRDMERIKKEEKKTRKEERKARKKLRHLEEGSHGGHNSTYEHEDEMRPRRRLSHSRSPSRWQGSRKREERRYGYGRRSTSPPPRNSRMRSRTPPARGNLFDRDYYGVDEMERKRERDKRRWDASNRRRHGPVAHQSR